MPVEEPLVAQISRQSRERLARIDFINEIVAEGLLVRTDNDVVLINNSAVGDGHRQYMVEIKVFEVV